jgi:zinc protease
MKTLITTVLTLSLAAATLAAQSTPPADGVRLPQPETLRLPNGLEIHLVEKRDVPLIAFSGRLRGGTISDPAGKEGTSTLLSELLQRGAGKRNAEQFSEAVDSVGGNLFVSSGREGININGEFMARDRALMLELLSDMLRRPQMPKDEFEKAQQRAIDAIAASKDSDPGQLMSSYFNAFIYGSHPYARRSDETSLAAVTHADVVRYFNEQVGADRAIFAFVGDFNARSFATELRRAFGDWKKAPGELAEAAMPTAPTGRRVLLIDKPDATQTYFWIGNLGVARNFPDRVVLDIANTAFGGRFTSMLNTELRVKTGLTYGARSTLIRDTAAGTQAISSFTRTDTTERAIDLALELLERLRSEGLDPATLASVQAYLAGQFPPQLETGNQIAARLVDLSFYGLDRSDVDEYVARVAAADREAVQQVIGSVYPAAENLTFVMIGNADAIRDVAAKYGEVTEMKITDRTFTPPPAAVR